MDSIENYVKEWQKRPLPECIKRDQNIRLKGSLASALTGMRRSGKTWRLFQEMEALQKEGVNPGNMLYINFDDDRLYLLEQNGAKLLNEITETFFRLNPVSRKKGAYFFFDEIQEVPGWARFARRIIDTEKVKLYLSGSSAKLLSTEIATEFRGRSFPFELLPFSFREYLRLLDMPETPSPLDRSEYENAFNNYLSTGGFPEALVQEDSLIRMGLLQSYVNSVVLRDVLERHNLANVRGVRELAHTLLVNNGQMVSVKRLSDLLAARNIPMGREMTGRICAFLEDAFLVFFVPLYAASLQKVRVNPQKVYAIDPGLSLALSLTFNLGQRFEQAVYLELRRRYPNFRQGGISYYLTASRREVDFVLGDINQGPPQALIQACAETGEPETRRRETEALEEAMTELKIKKSMIITLYEREDIKTAAGRIMVRPAWEWFLEEQKTY